MAFAARLRESLQFRQNQTPKEFANGDDLEQVLNRHLLTVESMADGELITSVLLLSPDGKRLSHGAAPRLPQSYRDAVDGAEIGPRAGSCGTAAYFGRPIYVSDIATDPLWTDWRDLSLPLGLKSCWSTPIRHPTGAVIGTFAIYRRTVGNPTSDEIDSIAMIAEHVVQAIVLAREMQAGPASKHRTRSFRLVVDQDLPFPLPNDQLFRLQILVTRLRSKTEELGRVADHAESQEVGETLKATTQLSWKLIAILQREIDEMNRATSG